MILGGIIGSLRQLHTRKARPGSSTRYADFMLEDVQGSMRCILWPDRFEQYGHLIEEDRILLLRGTADRRGGGEIPDLVVNDVILLDQVDSLLTQGVVIRLDQQQHGGETLKKLHEITRGYPGSVILELIIELADGTRVQLKSQSQSVDVTAEFRQRITDLLGPGNFQRRIASKKISQARRPADRQANHRQAMSRS